MSKIISIEKLLFFLVICLFSLSCALFEQNRTGPKKFGQVLEFISGSRPNTTLPPQYQSGTTIYGRINTNTIAIRVIRVNKGNKSEKGFELTDDDYQQCLKMIQNTNISEKEPTTGGGPSGIELLDGNGGVKTGEPSNKEEWIEFDKKIYDKANALSGVS